MTRDDISGSYTREDVARAIRLVLVEEASRPIRARALEMKKFFSSKDWNEVYVDKVYYFLEDTLCNDPFEQGYEPSITK